jgi:FMN-dependent NADH-azoreductase
MNRMYSIALGALAFCVISALIGAVLKKSPERIAQDKCAEIRGLTGAFGVNPSATVFVDGTAYSCE